MEYNNLNQNNKKDNTTKILISIVSVMAIAIIVLAIILITQKKTIVYIENQNQEISVEKENLKKQLLDLYDGYNELETNNDSLNTAILKEKEHIEALISELDRIKNYSYSIKKKYDEEIITLKSIMRSYVYQIDSLDLLNKQLIAENVQIKDQNKQTKQELELITEEKEELTQVIEGASLIKTAAIAVKFLTNKNKETDRSRKIEKLEVDFILVANNLAQAGTKRIYLRIIRPDGFVYTDGNTFEYREKKITYTAYRDVSYENNNLSVSIYYSINEKMLEGKYSIELYLNGDIIGTSSFNVEK